MKIRLYSDVHDEIQRAYNKYKYKTEGRWSPIELPDDKNTVLVLAGDIDKAKQIPELLNSLSPRFKAVIHISGNHEYYGSNITSCNKIMKENLLDNVYHLNNECVIIDDVKFICGTMWSPLKHPLAKFDVNMGMNDYKMIRHGTKDEPWKRKLTPDDTVGLHHKWLGFAYDELKCYEGKTCVVTHNSPWSPTDGESISEGWCSSQEDFILDMVPDLWLFGHDHSVSDKVLGNTRIISNCVGYFTEPDIYNDEVIEL